MSASIDFLPPAYVRKLAERRRKLQRVLMVAAAVLGLTGWWMLQDAWTQQLRDRHNLLSSQVTDAEQQVQERERLRFEQTQLQHQIRLHSQLRVPVTHARVVATISSLMPDSVGLTRVELHTQRPAPKAKVAEGVRARARTTTTETIQPDQIEIELSGVAPDDATVDAFVAALETEPMFSEVLPRSLRNDEQDGYYVRAFELTLIIDLRRTFRELPEDEFNTEGLAHAR